MKRGLFISGLALAATFIGISAVSAPIQGKSPNLPGITAKDPFPNGCVSCHVVLPDGTDVRLNKAMQLVKPHPSVTATTKNVPTDCLKCHKSTGKSPLSAALHKAHFGKKEKSVFVEKFEGTCFGCHALDLKTGEMKLKSGAKNW